MALRPTQTITTTMLANAAVEASRCSLASVVAASNVTNGWSNCVCDTRAIPPNANPLYHRKKPSNCDISARYKNAAKAGRFSSEAEEGR